MKCGHRDRQLYYVGPLLLFTKGVTESDYFAKRVCSRFTVSLPLHLGRVWPSTRVRFILPLRMLPTTYCYLNCFPSACELGFFLFIRYLSSHPTPTLTSANQTFVAQALSMRRIPLFHCRVVPNTAHLESIHEWW